MSVKSWSDFEDKLLVPSWETELGRLARLVVREHVRLNHQGKVRVLLAQFTWT